MLQNDFGKQFSPPEPFGPDGWVVRTPDNSVVVIVSCSPERGNESVEWVHASLRVEDRLPTYSELTWLHRAVFGDKWAYQVFAPSASHINIHETVLHLWGRLDGLPQLPDFGAEFNSI